MLDLKYKESFDVVNIIMEPVPVDSGLLGNQGNNRSLTLKLPSLNNYQGLHKVLSKKENICSSCFIVYPTNISTTTPYKPRKVPVQPKPKNEDLTYTTPIILIKIMKEARFNKSYLEYTF